MLPALTAAPRASEEKSWRERQKQNCQAAERTASAAETHSRVRIKKEKEDPGYERYAGGSQPPGEGSARRPQRDEEQRRPRRPAERSGEPSRQEPRARSDLWDKRERSEEAGRKGDGHGRAAGRARERSTADPQARPGERGSARASSRC